MENRTHTHICTDTRTYTHLDTHIHWSNLLYSLEGAILLAPYSWPSGAVTRTQFLPALRARLFHYPSWLSPLTRLCPGCSFPSSLLESRLHAASLRFSHFLKVWNSHWVYTRWGTVDSNGNCTGFQGDHTNLHFLSGVYRVFIPESWCGLRV